MFYNFVMLSGFFLLVFGVDNEVAFYRLFLFPFLFLSNKCINYPKYTGRLLKHR